SGEQTTFNFTFIAPDEGRASEFTAFAVTSLLPANPLSLELDTARATNTAPVAVNDSANVVKGSTVATTILVLANDSDADGDALTLSAVSQPAQGVVNIINAGKALSYQAPIRFVGTETFGYTVIDGKGGSAAGRVTVQVQVPTGLASLRVTGAHVGSRADAIACPIVRNGVCASPAPLFETSRFFNETTGIPGSDQTTEAAGANFDGMNVSVDTEGSFTVSGFAGNAGQIELRCRASGNGTGSGGRTDVAYGGSSASGSSVTFRIEGEGALRYEINVVSSASGVTPPDKPSAGQVSVSLGQGFEVRHTSVDGRSQIGENSGFLEVGSYSVDIVCIDKVSGAGGSANGSGVVSLTLSP
ncbi:Ig-like domain-containing protein, partial [Stenotrophobium rhamnosiphilum]